MTSVQWKRPLLATALLLILNSPINFAVSLNKDSSKMIDDGWRPIVGGQRDSNINAEITYYRNPASKKSDPVKAEKPKPVKVHQVQKQAQVAQHQSQALKLESTTKKTPVAKVPVAAVALNHAKIPPHSKPLYLLTNIGVHAPQMPMAMQHHRPGGGHKIVMKMHPVPLKRHKPLRHHQMPAYSNRDEVFVPAPSNNLGPYTFYAAGGGQQPQKNRGAQSHIEFANHFPIPNSDDELYQIVRAPVHQYVIPAKTQIQNDVHYTFQNPDDYHRNNVVHHQTSYKFEPTKEKIKKQNGNKDLPRHEALISKIPFHTVVTPAATSTPQQNKDRTEVQVTKEKLNVFHNAIPPHWPLDQFTYKPVKTTTLAHKIPTYEVTEGKWNHETPFFQFRYTMPTKSRPPSRLITEEVKPFLPTPLKPEVVQPTNPTEAEISTIYNQLVNTRHVVEPTAPIGTERTNNFFDVKEVSTHYPILGIPDYQAYPTRFSLTDENKENEITTKNNSAGSDQNVSSEEDATSSRPNQQRKRPNRRRRPSTSTTTTEAETHIPEVTTQIYEAQKTSVDEVTRRRPLSRFRTTTTFTTTTTQNYEDTTTQVPRHRFRKTRPTTTEHQNHQYPVEEEDNQQQQQQKQQEQEEQKQEEESLEDKLSKLTTTTEREFPASFESHFTASYKSDPPPRDFDEYVNRYTNPPSREDLRKKVESNLEDLAKSSEEQNEEEKILEDLKQQYQEPQRDGVLETAFNTPDNELEITTSKGRVQESTTETPTTITIATTTSTTTTEVPKRVRGRPVKYEPSNRPRFSVKDYRQRLTTTSTTVEPSTVANKSQNEGVRLRYPNRQRRPVTIVTPSSMLTQQEETHEMSRMKFTPKEPRHQNQNPYHSTDSSTEKSVNTVNSRLRPFGRYKPTPDPPTTTSKVSIKPNIFNNLRRPTPISLKTRILARQRNATMLSTSLKPEMTTPNPELSEDSGENEADMTEAVETTIPYSVDGSVEFGAKSTVETTQRTELFDKNREDNKNDDFMQSQFVSDLTSSISNKDFNKPGLFKNVSPNSRKVPNYFTLETEDPILPIEAFFPKLKEKQ